MGVQDDHYLSAYLRKPRIPDTVVVPETEDQSKTVLPPRGPGDSLSVSAWAAG